MTPKQVIKHFGSVQKTALAIGMTTQCVYKWQDQGYIPYPSQRIIELLTEHKLEAVKK
jgi:hypothetical protein